jgi:hypothetical protein
LKKLGKAGDPLAIALMAAPFRRVHATKRSQK